MGIDYKKQMNSIANQMKVTVYKPQDRLDDRITLCGSPVQYDEEGRQYFIIPASHADYQSKLHPHYIFGDAFMEGMQVSDNEEKRRPGRPKGTE